MTLILGLEAAISHKIQSLTIKGDSQLVVNQILGEYECKNSTLLRYSQKVIELMARIAKITIEYIPRGQNVKANELD